MAKNPNFTRNMVDKFSIRGHLGSDGETITYINDEKEELETTVAKCFKNFINEDIELTIAVKVNQDLGNGIEEE